MSNVHEALNDINWLSKRLKGIITLSEEIDSYDTLKTQTEEMKSSLSTLKSQLIDMNKKAADHTETYTQLMKSYDAEIARRKTEDDAIIAKVMTQAQEIVAKAERDAKALRYAAQQDKLSIEKEITSSRETLKGLNNETIYHATILEKLQQDIANLKAKF